MASWLLALVTAFGAVFVLELPDKTTALTLVLTTRFHALPVVAGAAVAFTLQSIIAVGLGSAITLLPERLVAAAVAVLFGVGAFLLFREGFSRQDSDELGDQAASARPTASFLRAALTSFGMLFAAEWGDASQLAAVGVAARYAQPVAVMLGTWLALMAVTGLAVLVGRKIRSRVPAHWVQRGAGVVFGAFALVALVQAVLG
ncbi:TMEM165/GDT1 family protein [Goodfellowiella coeruleoviolacea]|uniref:GDT1 family protein n=1 Tax=Goodfellowiella coeruleoviolacea TaxID=334858 RepID=A0AAE3GA79_9PSEU|nr:TMEM165/GDT1 family protein [Goodfellowiella coeruleoviolacea]MCP2164365.1 putative Ca2+/H+ antiporter, TMEM165/GDT1 family [Goodfellowiella coeruleoviolacea]